MSVWLPFDEGCAVKEVENFAFVKGVEMERMERTCGALNSYT